MYLGESVIDFLMQNSSAIFALIGALSGALVTGFINFMVKKREVKLRIAEKLLDKKLEAHEALIELTSWIRSMVLLGGKDQNQELNRSPFIMQSQENMSDFLLQLNKVQSKIDRWLSAASKREVSLFLDYFVNLNEYAQNASGESLQRAGALIRNDFIIFALRLENCAHDFFNKELMKLRFRTDRNWHKYPKEKTYEELNKTVLFENKQKVLEILHGIT
jgi:hypothetical protein